MRQETLVERNASIVPTITTMRPSERTLVLRHSCDSQTLFLPVYCFSCPVNSLVGGIPVLLPMFVPAWSDVGINNLPLLVPQPLPSRAYIQALSFLVLLLEDDPAQTITFKNAGGIELLSCLIRRAPPSHLNVELITAIQQICLSLKNRDEELYKAALKYLMFDFTIWGAATNMTHIILLSQLEQIVDENTSIVKTCVGIRPLLAALDSVYYTKLTEKSSKRDPSMTNDQMDEFQQQIVNIIEKLLICNNVVMKQDAMDLLAYIMNKPANDVLVKLLKMIYGLLSRGM